METPYTLRHFQLAVGAFFAVLGAGTIAFALSLHDSGLDAFYRSTVTISLTGIDTKPPNASGEVITIVLVLAGVAIYGYLASAIVELIAHGVLSGAVADRRRRRMIDSLSDHYIICGYGRVGREVADEFRAAGVPFVVLDVNPAVLEIAREDGVPYVEGSGTNDDDLGAAGLARSRGVVASSDSDVDNLYITVSARAERPDLTIVARASTEDAAAKMLRAGADRVVQPYTSAGQEMAALMLKPQVSAFLDIVSRHGGPDLRFEEIEVTTDCPQAGKTIRDTRIRHETGALVVALKKADGSFDTTPNPDVQLHAGDVLIAVGTAEELRALEELFARLGPLPVSPLSRLEAALAGAVGTTVELERPPDVEHGDYATSVALKAAPAQRRPPREIAEELAAVAGRFPEVERAEVAGPGFVNLTLAPEWFRDSLAEVVAAGDAYGSGWAVRPQRVQVEMVSANPTGPITVASARNGAIGDSVARLLERAGHTVEREYYYNDAGVQMDRFRASVEAIRLGREPPEDGYRGEYVVELAAVGGDPVPPMLERIERTLERFRVHFDSWSRQSELEKRLPELLSRLDTYEHDGAVWARSSAYGDEEDRVLIRSDGGAPTYRAADVVYLVDKLERDFDRAIYVLGADHHGTRNWYAAVARMLGYDPERVEVLLYQLVHLTRAGEQTKMSKRRGDVVFLDEFMDEIGVDAARWYLVNRSPDQTIEIDVDLAAERTEKNPVYYVQYAHARIAGIMRNAAELPVADEDPELGEQERDLVKRLLEFPAVAAEAAERRAPHMLTVYAIRTADDFHRFYHHNRVIADDVVLPFRRDLARATQTVIASSLGLVGVEAPERM